MSYDELRQEAQLLTGVLMSAGSVAEVMCALIDENEAMRAQVREADDAALLHDDWCSYREALRIISSTAGPTAKWARDIAEQALGDAS